MIQITLSTDGKHFIARGGHARDHIHTLITKWPGWKRLRHTSGGISVFTGPASAVSAICLQKQHTIPIQWDPAANHQAGVLIQDLAQARKHLENGHAPDSNLASLPTSRRPMPHQWQAIMAARAMKWRLLLADDMGLGKTATALWCVHDSKASRLLVVSPVSVKWNWRDEIRETLGMRWVTIVIDGPARQRANQFSEARAHLKVEEKASPLALVINYDLLMYLSDEQHQFLKDFVEGQFLVCDESHYLKNREAKRTKLVHDLFGGIDGAAQRMLLTGTPIRNMVDDLYSQITLVQPGTWTSYWDFANRHLDIARVTMGKRTVNKITGAKDIDGLNKVVNVFQIQRKMDDVLNLPDKIYSYPHLELDGPMKTIYKAMREEALIALEEFDDDDNIFSPSVKNGVSEVMLRCEQIAQGFMGGIPDHLMAKVASTVNKTAETILDRPRELIFPNHPKIVWLMETIEGLLSAGKHPIIFSRFNAPLFWLFWKFEEGVSTAVMHGGLCSEDKHALVESFQGGDLDMLFVQVKMAEGFNLQRSHDVIFLGRDWSPAINRQAEARCRRIGTRGSVNIQIPVVHGTIETLIHKKLMDKEADAQQALRNVTIKELKEAL